jgi:hypothetical protein
MSYTCPRCGMTSYNENDERYSYCGNCHAFTQPDLITGIEDPDVREQLMADFGYTADELPNHTGQIRRALEKMLKDPDWGWLVERAIHERYPLLERVLDTRKAKHS